MGNLACLFLQQFDTGKTGFRLKFRKKTEKPQGVAVMIVCSRLALGPAPC